MKNSILLILFISLIFASCNKEDVQPNLNITDSSYQLNAKNNTETISPSLNRGKGDLCPQETVSYEELACFGGSPCYMEGLNQLDRVFDLCYFYKSCLYPLSSTVTTFEYLGIPLTVDNFAENIDNVTYLEQRAMIDAAIEIGMNYLPECVGTVVISDITFSRDALIQNAFFPIFEYTCYDCGDGNPGSDSSL